VASSDPLCGVKRRSIREKLIFLSFDGEKTTNYDANSVMNAPIQPPARSSKLSEDIFAPALEQKARALFDAVAVVRSYMHTSYAERSLYAVYHEAKLLEDYLDSHGAADNKRFHLIREEVSGLKWISQALSCLSLLKSGPIPYPAASADWSQGGLDNHVEASTASLHEYLEKLFTQLCSSWVGADLSLITPKEVEVAIHPPMPILPPDLVSDDDRDANEDSKAIAPRYLSRFIRLFNNWDVATTQRLVPGSDTDLFMKTYCTEATARSFQSKVHNLQSDYDSHLRNTSLELASPQLRKVRGSVSECLHLLEAVTALTHLYERHHHRTRISTAVPWDALVALIANHLILPAYKSLESCIPLAQQLLNELTISDSVVVELIDGVEMHARPLSMIANMVKHHGLDIEIECAGQRANAASFMAMLVLIGSHPEVTTYTFHGDSVAIADIKQLFALGLGDTDLDAVTKAFPFLK
jgi:phosphotransferase system HPr-like phosphotransfer protein